MRPGVWQLIAVIVIILLLFGARRLPDLARGVAQSLNVFKKEINGSSPEDEAQEPDPSRRDVDTTKDSPQ